MMGFLIRLFFALVAALVIGMASAWWVVGNVAETHYVANGPWRIAPNPTGDKIGPYTRAAIARTDIMMPAPHVELVLAATEDEAGAPLRGDCSYRIEGERLPARGWSVAAYDPHHMLIAGTENHTGKNSESPAEGGRFVVNISARAQQGSGLSLEDARSFSLLFRLYAPDPRIIEAPANFNAPRIIKEGCP